MTQTLYDLEWGEKNWKKVKNEKYTLQELAHRKNTDKLEEGETNMVGHEIWRERLKNVQNEKNTLQDLEYGEKQ